MIPHMKLWQRVVAWALWRLNGWNDPEDCRFECMTHPELSRVVGLMCDYWYVRHARKLAGAVMDRDLLRFIALVVFLFILAMALKVLDGWLFGIGLGA